jgi:hypothetical protein
MKRCWSKIDYKSYLASACYTYQTMILKGVQQQRVHRAYIIMMISLPIAISDFGNLLFAQAQTINSTFQNGRPTSETLDTFQIDGAIGSLVSDLMNSTMSEEVSGSVPVYILVGNWSMGVVNGEINYLQVDFVMGLENGTHFNAYSIENIRNIVIPSAQPTGGEIPNEEPSNSLVLSSTNNYSLSLFGYVDVLIGDSVQWQNVPVSIDVFNGNTISILLYPAETNNQFKGQPIYGIVTSMLDANSGPIKPSIWTAGA